MEHAWIVSKDDEIEAVLAHPDLHVRPPGQAVPAAMAGTVLGDVFARLVRMNEGERHTELRARVQRIIAAWDVDRVHDLAREAASTMDPREVGGYVVAVMAGLHHPAEATSLIRDFAGAIAGGASDEAMARGIDAAPRLLQLLPAGGDVDERANLLGFLFQAYAAVGTMISNGLSRRTVPPVVMTRRWAASDVELFGVRINRGDMVAVLLTSPAFAFGAGRHACPGEAIAHAIVNGAVPPKQEQ